MPFELPESLVRQTIKCEYCDVELLGKTSNQRFCSTECRLTFFYAQKIEVCCPGCKVKFNASENLANQSRNNSESKG